MNCQINRLIVLTHEQETEHGWAAVGQHLSGPSLGETPASPGLWFLADGGERLRVALRPHRLNPLLSV